MHTSSYNLKISNDEIHLILCPISTGFSKEQRSSFFEILSQTEKDKITRYKFEKDQLQSLVSRALLRSLCSTYLATNSPDQWKFENKEKGKPFLINAISPFKFNVSHSHNLIAIAISKQHELGVDIEHISNKSNVASIANRFFSKLEIQALNKFPAETRNDHFFDFWTLKESYIKGCGQGLSIPLDSFSFEIDHKSNRSINSNIKLRFHQEHQDISSHWQSFLMDVAPNYRGAISALTHNPTLKLKIKTFTCLPLEPPEPITLPLVFR